VLKNIVHFDHVLPYVKGGTSIKPENLQKALLKSLKGQKDDTIEMSSIFLKRN
jgi:hypothetical protein